MRVLLDTNIIIDYFTGRAPFGPHAKALWSFVISGHVQPAVTADSATTVYYILGKMLGSAQARQAVADLVAGCEILSVDRAVLETALLKNWPDFEDAVKEAAVELAGIPVIVTRDPKGFASSTRQIIDAEALVQQLSKSQTP
jgi:predicted nucleic acid-binding protein